MITLSCLWFLFAALLVPSANSQVVALSAEENVYFINEVLELLNNQKECIVPTFEEVDGLNLSFNELEELWGADFESKLSEDQKLLKNTILDQWESFQKRTHFGVVIRSAKKRSFLCKVESYQKAKFGSSVCTGTDVISNPKSDASYERNPIVRYIKHLESQGVADGEPQKFEIQFTPISSLNSLDVDFSPRGGIKRGSERGSARSYSESEAQEYDKDEIYDPLADIPDVSVHSSDSDSEDGSNPFAKLESSVAGNAFAPREEEDIQDGFDHSHSKLGDAHLGPAGNSNGGSSAAADFGADVAKEISTEARGVEDSTVTVADASNAAGLGDSAGDSYGQVGGDSGSEGTKNVAANYVGEQESSIASVDGSALIEAALSAEKARGVEDDADQQAEGAPDDGGSNVAADGDDDLNSLVASFDGAALAEAASGENDVTAATAGASASTTKSDKMVRVTPASDDVVYVDDKTDDKYLARLTKIRPMLFEFGITYKGLKWPDESSAGESNFDNTVKIDWNRFVNSPYSCMSDVTLFDISDAHSRVGGGGSLWSAGPKSEERYAITDWDQAPTPPIVEAPSLQQSALGARAPGKVSRKSSKIPRFICKSFTKLCSSKKHSKEKRRLMRAQSDIII